MRNSRVLFASSAELGSSLASKRFAPSLLQQQSDSDEYLYGEDERKAVAGTSSDASTQIYELRRIFRL